MVIASERDLSGEGKALCIVAEKLKQVSTDCSGAAFDLNCRSDNFDVSVLQGAEESGKKEGQQRGRE